MPAIAVLIRALTYAAVFVGVLLVLLPRQLLVAAGVAGPKVTGIWQVVATLAVLAGAALALWCILAFVFVGHGTPFPLDAPRRLVVRGPYGSVRNPMYLGAAVALLGAALYYRSLLLAGYAVLFAVACHLFVVLYEEPTLRTTFGADYSAYCQKVGRWIPSMPRVR